MRPRLFWTLAALAIMLSPRAMAAPQPFQLLEGQVVMTITVGGRETLALIDTGAERSMIEAKLAGELGLRTKMPIGRTYFGASGKSIDFAWAERVELVVSGQTLRRNLAVFPSDGTFAAKGVQVLIGRDLLLDQAIAIDFEHMTIDLTPSAKFKPPEGKPLKLSNDWQGRPALRIDVNGKAADVMLDTAATGGLHLSDRFADDAGLIAGQQTSRKTITGIDGSHEQIAVIAPTVAIAGESFGNVEATVSPLGTRSHRVDGIDGVVGVKLLRQFNFTIDYSRNQAWLTPNRKPWNHATDAQLMSAE